MKECNVFYELKCFQVELLFQTEGLCVWREETTDMQLKKKNVKKEKEKEECKKGRPSANGALHGETEKHSLHGSSIRFPTEPNSKVCVFVRSGPLD